MTGIYFSGPEADARLQELFGLNRADFFPIVREVVGARAVSVDDDPRSAKGMFAYIHGTRNVRGVFRALGWQLHRFDGVETVKHPSLELQVAYQSVDLAADAGHVPRAISGKGPGAERLIDLGQGRLFADEELESLNRQASAVGRRGMYFFCVSVDGDDVRAELSCASEVSGGNFSEFSERIFVVRGGEWGQIRLTDSDDSGAAEFEPVVTRK